MSYVLVTADFPNISSQQRDSIYQCLKDKKWIKEVEPGRDIDKVWYASFQENVTESTTIRISIDDFVNYSESYCNVKLALQWGPNQPTFHGLV